jgi:hypothetical protein
VHNKSFPTATPMPHSRSAARLAALVSFRVCLAHFGHPEVLRLRGVAFHSSPHLAHFHRNRCLLLPSATVSGSVPSAQSANRRLFLPTDWHRQNCEPLRPVLHLGHSPPLLVRSRGAAFQACRSPQTAPPSTLWQPPQSSQTGIVLPRFTSAGVRVPLRVPCHRLTMSGYSDSHFFSPVLMPAMGANNERI